MREWIVSVRVVLERLREQHVPFDLAWTRATAGAPDEWQPILTFARKHFQAAYDRDESKFGRMRVDSAVDPREVNGLVRFQTQPGNGAMAA